MPKLAEPQLPCPTCALFGASRVDRELKVIPTDGCHRHVGRERMLFKISGGQLTSSRTGWIPNVTEFTRDEQLSRVGPSQDPQPNGVPADTGVGTLCREVPLGLLGRVALADEGPDGL